MAAIRELERLVSQPKSIMDRVVKLTRLAASTVSEAEHDNALREVARLKRKHRLTDEAVAAALEAASEPYVVDAGLVGVESPSVAVLLNNVFGDDVEREGGRVVARSKRATHAEDAARRCLYLSEQLRECAARRKIRDADKTVFYSVVAMTVEDRLLAIKAKATKASVPSSWASRATPALTRQEKRREQSEKQPDASKATVTSRASIPRLTRLGDLRTAPGVESRRPRLGEVMSAAFAAKAAAGPFGGLPQHVVEAGVEEGELRIDLEPLTRGVDWNTCPKSKER